MLCSKYLLQCPLSELWSIAGLGGKARTPEGRNLTVRLCLRMFLRRLPVSVVLFLIHYEQKLCEAVCVCVGLHCTHAYTLRNTHTYACGPLEVHVDLRSWWAAGYHLKHAVFSWRILSFSASLMGSFWSSSGPAAYQWFSSGMMS